MKTKEELLALRAEAETLKKKLAELNEEELAQVIGGGGTSIRKDLYENIILKNTPPSDPKEKKDNFIG